MTTIASRADRWFLATGDRVSVLDVNPGAATGYPCVIGVARALDGLDCQWAGTEFRL